MSKFLRTIMCALLVFTMTTSSLVLVGCSSDDSSSTQTTQDDCYGDDLPVVNE